MKKLEKILTFVIALVCIAVVWWSFNLFREKPKPVHDYNKYAPEYEINYSDEGGKG